MSARENRTVLLCGTDSCLTRMLTYELTRAGFTIAADGQADCALVDLDSTDELPAGLPAVGYSRRGAKAPADVPVLSRPFAMDALLAALTQLEQAETPDHPAAGDLRLDDTTRTVSRNATRLALMPAEYAVLCRLLAAGGEPVDRAALIAALPSGCSPTSNLAEVVVCSLRRKLEASFGIRPIRTVRGVGYRYTP